MNIPGGALQQGGGQAGGRVARGASPPLLGGGQAGGRVARGAPHPLLARLTGPFHRALRASGLAPATREIFFFNSQKL